MASIIDVAKDAGVSVATVSYVFSQKKYVSPELTKRVFDSAKRLNYNVNPLASGLRNRATKEIGVVLHNIRRIFFCQVLSGLEDTFRRNGYNLLYYDTDCDFERERSIINQLHSRWADGIIFYSCVSEEEKASYAEFLTQGNGEKEIPFISLDRQFQTPKIPVVTYQHEKCLYEATRHLISLGRRNIVHFAMNSGWDFALARTNGYLRAMREASLDRYIRIIPCGISPALSYEACREALQAGYPIDAICASSDPMAVGCMRALKDAKISIPDEIALTGCENLFVSSMTEPSITTSDAPKYELGTTTAALMLKLLRNEPHDEITTLDTNLIVRGSTDKNHSAAWELRGW